MHRHSEASIQMEQNAMRETWHRPTIFRKSAFDAETGVNSTTDATATQS
jgi:hypothetical protein